MMRQFFHRLPAKEKKARGKVYPRHCTQNEAVAVAYANFMWNERSRDLANSKEVSRSRYYVGIGLEGAHFGDATKRSVMISDTLLLSHGNDHEFQLAGSFEYSDNSRIVYYPQSEMDPTPPAVRRFVPATRSERTEYGFFCPDLETLGSWIADAKPLLKAGLTWYLPNYATRRETSIHYETHRGPLRRAPAVDYLLRDGRAIDSSGVEPATGHHVREILRMDLPFLDGVSLRDFGDITTHEFASYAAFRNFLRGQLLELDEAMNDVQSQRELDKIGLQIMDEVHAMRSQLRKAGRTRAVSVAGGLIATVTASLVAVYGPSLEQAVAVLGIEGAGAWALISSLAANDTTALREDKWYYVWALSHAAQSL
ncbi:hypothetical protein ACFWBR_27130 [Streptomyces sp. NPDC060006]|uniref:hypothetical protein n=1 Tax=unclassified Streptomyces TaxID=2593676 RepID=UPI00368535E1